MESGILELYVLGDLSPEEKLKVEEMATLYPEVKAELAEIEKTLGELADSYAIEPSEGLRDNFLSKLTFNEEDTNTSISNVNLNNKQQTFSSHNNAKVIPLNSSKLNFYKYSFAACFTLLIMSIAALFVLYNNLQESKEQLAVLQSSNQDYANQVNYLDKKVESTNEILSIYTNPDFKLVELKGTANSPESKMLVAFNPKEQKVMIDMKNMSMPAHDENHQYQLWALVDGKPVDLGVFDGVNPEAVMKKMKAIDKAQAFAVTLEPKGGSVNPTLEKMMVMGAI
ncbi:anti-sigma factor [Pedobacter glucosidilyticus]|uniref:anti-sigma factor n=1 Tax=Pedobacter glucosidilyticus TaxID=1122941 RepID=UPI0026EF72B5|nr:anti-sigma factor [Pedobacter glucosidilyticus]